LKKKTHRTRATKKRAQLRISLSNLQRIRIFMRRRRIRLIKKIKIMVIINNLKFIVFFY